MPRDKSTRPCGDCGTKATSWEWCDTCQHWVGDECNETHDCVGLAIATSMADTEESEDGDTGEAEHAIDCDDPTCLGCDAESDEEE